MNNNMIAIVDFYNQDIGLKILFPEADYFVLEKEFERAKLNLKYNIKQLEKTDCLNSQTYKTIFIIAPLYDATDIFINKKKPAFFVEKTKKKLLDMVSLIKGNAFSRVCFFDNYDYDYDPNLIFSDDLTFVADHEIIFFKRNYSKYKEYKPNVFPFPYIMFGPQCNIDMVSNRIRVDPVAKKIPRLFFSGTLLNHVDYFYNIFRNRNSFYSKLCVKNNICNPGHLPHEEFIKELSSSKYCLDLLGVGDPNIRTFEILAVGSLRIGQRSDLKWPFPEEFRAETIFENDNDLYLKIKTLESNTKLYLDCLQKQNEIVDNFMNTTYLRQYILDTIYTSK